VCNLLLQAYEEKLEEIKTAISQLSAQLEEVLEHAIGASKNAFSLVSFR